MRGGIGLGIPRAPAPPPPWSPLAFAGLVFLVRGELVTLDGSNNVSAWPNKGGAATVAQATSGTRPGTGTIGGRPSVRTTANSKRLDVTSFPTLTAASLWLVLTKTAAATAYLLSDVSGNFGIIQNFSGSALEWFNGGGADRLTIAANPSAGAHVVLVTQTNGGALTIYLDGAQVATKATAAASFPVLRAIFNLASATSNGWVGDVGQAGAVNRVLSASERKRLHQYLGAGYGVAMA